MCIAHNSVVTAREGGLRLGGGGQSGGEMGGICNSVNNKKEPQASPLGTISEEALATVGNDSSMPAVATEEPMWMRKKVMLRSSPCVGLD